MAADPSPRRPAPGRMGERVTDTLREAKRELRTALRLRRSTRTDEERREADRQRLETVIGLLEPAYTAGRLAMVATYLSHADEPDTLQLVAWLAAHEVPTLLPVITRGGPNWALYGGPESLRLGPRGIPEPTGRPLGPEGLAAAEVIVCPGLAANRAGVRLGQGGGWYDRALEHARPDAVTAILLDDDEVLGTVPAESHDHPMDMIITPSEIITRARET